MWKILHPQNYVEHNLMIIIDCYKAPYIYKRFTKVKKIIHVN